MLANIIPDFLKAQENKTPLKDLFYPDVKNKFIATFPESIVPTEADIQKYGKEKAEQVLDKLLLERIMQWFPNNMRPGSKVCFVQAKSTLASAPQKPKAEDRRSCQNYSQSCIRIMPARRTLQPFQAYQVLFYKGEVKEAQEAARKAYVAQCEKDGTTPMGLFAFRNRWLRDRLESESDEVKAQVEERRKIHVSKSQETDDERNQRYAKNIPKMPKTLQGIGQSVAEETGWFVSITVGGPHPSYGGKLVTLSYCSQHFGRTPDGKGFAEFIGKEEYDRHLHLFDDFLLASFDDTNRTARAVEHKEGPVEYDNVDAYSEGEEDEEEKDDKDDADADADNNNDQDSEGEGDQLTTQSASNAKTGSEDDKQTPKAKKSATSQLSEYELERERNIARNKAKLQELGLLSASSKILGAKKKKTAKQHSAKATESNREQDEEEQGGGEKEFEGDNNPPQPPEHSKQNNAPQADSSISTGALVSDEQPPLLPTTTVTDGSQTAVGYNESTIQGGPTEGNDAPTAIAGVGLDLNEEANAIPPAASNHDVPQDEVDLEKNQPTDDEMAVDFKFPVPAHMSSLWEYLSGNSNATWRALLEQYLEFESTSPPLGVCLYLACQPRCDPPEVGLWMKRHRKAGTPKEVTADDFGPRLLGWWHSLQPEGRVTPDLSPSSYRREDTAVANGLSLFVVAFAWWMSANGDNPLSSTMAELLKDVIWVLGRLISSATPCRSRAGPGGSTGRTKRGKVQDDSDTPAPKRRRRGL
ncbi:hypothetical protein BKA70DRAFT_1239037 [Coprinopsis sp. MPI-PUGE-AT-0042]|nr:hypothetical protein BKA70DRAFT_1239037 [Coprinopsis sp. MPI-PUGE-AT-0042]